MNIKLNFRGTVVKPVLPQIRPSNISIYPNIKFQSVLFDNISVFQIFSLFFCDFTFYSYRNEHRIFK